MLHPLLLHPLILRPLILRSGPSWVCVSKDEGSLASTSQPAGTLVLRDAMRSRIAPQEEGVGLLDLTEHPHNAPYPATLSGAGLGWMYLRTLMEGRRGTAGFASPSLPAVECEKMFVSTGGR